MLLLAAVRFPFLIHARTNLVFTLLFCQPVSFLDTEYHALSHFSSYHVLLLSHRLYIYIVYICVCIMCIAASSRAGASRHSTADKVGLLPSTADDAGTSRQKTGEKSSASSGTRSQQRTTKDSAVAAGSDKTRPERGRRNAAAGASGSRRKHQRAESTSSASSDTSTSSSSSSSGASTSSGLHSFHSYSWSNKDSLEANIRVPTGQGKLEKVSEFEWSGKGRGKIFFSVKVRENEKLVPTDVRFLG